MKLAYAALVATLALPLPALALTNGDFETGDLTGWTKIGSGGAVTSSIGVTPTQGTYMGYIESTGNFTASASTIVPALGLDNSDIMGLSIGAAPTNGTGLYQTITVNPGDTLYFSWNFLTSELDQDPQYNDYAFLTVDGAAFLLGSRNSSTWNTISPPAGFNGQTGWFTDSYNFATGGSHFIGFAVFNVIDGGHNSALLLDNLNIPTSVPEPATLALSLLAVPFILARKRPR